MTSPRLFLRLLSLCALLSLTIVSCAPETTDGAPEQQAQATAISGGSGATPAATETAEVGVVASFYPLYEVVRRVGGDRVNATNLVAAGAEPHDLELSPRDLDRLRQASLLVYVGAGFQPGLEEAVRTAAAPDLAVLDVLSGMPLIEGQDEDHEGEAEHEEQHQQDPHVWLDPVRMQDVVRKVRDELVRVDPAGRKLYETNASAYEKDLETLHREFVRGLENCRRREVVTSHAAFGYLTDRYNLEQIPITGLSPEVEPSPKRLQEIVRFAREHDVKVIYFETLVDPGVAETIAGEVGARTLVLNPIEGLTPEQQAEDKDYLDLMRENLHNLRSGLECS